VYKLITEVPAFDVNKRDSNLGPLPDLNKSIISDQIIPTETLLKNTTQIIDESEDPLSEIDLDLSPYLKGEKGHLIIYIEATKVGTFRVTGNTFSKLWQRPPTCC
jgi:hypothetical protein